MSKWVSKLNKTLAYEYEINHSFYWFGGQGNKRLCQGLECCGCFVKRNNLVHVPKINCCSVTLTLTTTYQVVVGNFTSF